MPTVLGNIDEVPMAEEFGDNGLGAGWLKKGFSSIKSGTAKVVTKSAGATGGVISKGLVAVGAPQGVADAVAKPLGKYATSTLANKLAPQKAAPKPAPKPAPSVVPAVIAAPVAAVTAAAEQAVETVKKKPLIALIPILAILGVVGFLIWKKNQNRA